MAEKRCITVLGGGSWGTALAALLARNGNDVLLWAFDEGVMLEINNFHHNTSYLQGVHLPESLKATQDLQEAMEYSDLVISVIPMEFMWGILKQCKRYITPEHRWLVASKGIEERGLMFPFDVLIKVCGEECTRAVLGGPNFARDVGDGGFTTTVIASKDQNFAQELSGYFTSPVFKVEFSQDTVGLQVCGVFKNVLAFTVGIARGMGLSDSTVACIIVRGLDEMTNLVKALGGSQETVYGLAGLGDFILTSTSLLSRNMQAGKRFGQGVDIKGLRREFFVMPEGLNALPSVVSVAQNCGVKIQICETAREFVYDGLSVGEFLENVLL